MKCLKVCACLVGLMCLISPALAGTRFVDRQKRPIDEIRVLGTRIVTVEQVRKALEMGPDDLENSVDLMRGVLPYFTSVNWKILEEDGKRIAVITVNERFPQRPRLFDPDGNFSVNAGLNRVQGVQLGGKFQLTNQPDKSVPPRGKLIVGAEYGFANELWNYELGGELSFGWLKRKHLTLTGKVHRTTEVMDRDVLPSNGEQLALALLSGTEWRDYYLREGEEASVLWKPDEKPYSVRVTFLDEEHSSLPVASRWSVFGSDKDVLFNRLSALGRLRSVVTRFGYDTERHVLDARPGWRNTLDVERADPSIGSEFDFSRIQATLRRYHRIGRNRLDTRLVFGTSAGTLPLQRQYGLGGPGSLRGYPDDEFFGNHVAMLNVDYRRRLFHAFVDVGQTTNSLEDFDALKVKANVGAGIHFGDGFRLNLSQPLDDRGPRLDARWSRMF